MSYSNGFVANYRFPAVAIDTAAVAGRIYPPSGMTGRLIDIQVNLTVATTVAASALTLGTVADADAYGTLTVPVQAINTGVNGVVLGTDKRIDEDTIITLTSDGGATAGDGDVNVLIEWS